MIQILELYALLQEQLLEQYLLYWIMPQVSMTECEDEKR